MLRILTLSLLSLGLVALPAAQLLAGEKNGPVQIKVYKAPG